MKNILAVTVLLLLSAVNALAGSEYDKCIKEEKALKADEASQCSGLRYLLNPSACFSTQKALKEFTSGKCKKIGISENVEFNVQSVIQEKKVIDSANTRQQKVDTGLPQQESTFEQLKEENARLKTEISHLKAEIEQLRKTGQ